MLTPRAVSILFVPPHLRLPVVAEEMTHPVQLGLLGHIGEDEALCWRVIERLADGRHEAVIVPVVDVVDVWRVEERDVVLLGRPLGAVPRVFWIPPVDRVEVGRSLRGAVSALYPRSE
jgi:hypothetical protein